MAELSGLVEDTVPVTTPVEAVVVCVPEVGTLGVLFDAGETGTVMVAEELYVPLDAVTVKESVVAPPLAARRAASRPARPRARAAAHTRRAPARARPPGPRAADPPAGAPVRRSPLSPWRKSILPLYCLGV